MTGSVGGREVLGRDDETLCRRPAPAAKRLRVRIGRRFVRRHIERGLRRADEEPWHLARSVGALLSSHITMIR